MKGIPQISLDLIQYLETLYQDQMPDIELPDRKVWFAAGQVDVVRHLKRTFEEQQQTILEGTDDVRRT